MASFAEQIRAICAKTKTSVDEAVKTAVILASQQLVTRSPVGDPDHWQANARQKTARETYNDDVDAHNAQTGSGPGRKRRKGTKALRKAFPNRAGKGYVGGRFRANWQIGIASPNTATTDLIDPAGGATIGRLTSVAAAVHAGGVIYITNSLPYAIPLERGHSKQAPQGMVRLTMIDLPAALEASLRNRRP